ncbi:hypothetical protein ACSBR1_030618 [Camellia fascicularis]
MGSFGSHYQKNKTWTSINFKIGLGKKPTDDMFKDHLNLHNFIKNALPDRVMEIVDPCILLEHDTRRSLDQETRIEQ